MVDRHLTDRSLLLVVIAAFVTLLSLYYFVVVNAHKHDFALFVYEGRQWVEGRQLYTTVDVNTNSPALTVSLFALLALVPDAAVRWIWAALMLAALAATWRVIARELGWTLDKAVAAVALGLLMHGSVQALSVGQLTIPLLLYPVTRAWVSYRRGQLIGAGCWLGPVIAVKPPLALAALLLPVKTWCLAGALSLSLSMAALPFTGLEPWRAWLKAGGTIFWLAHPSNVSVWGMAARWTDSRTLSDFSPIVVALVVLAGAVFAAHVLTQQNRDKRMLGAVLWSVLISPLGWVHYIVLVVGPVAPLWRGSWSTWLAYLLLLLPFGGQLQVGPILGSLYFVAALLLWASVIRRPAGQCMSVETI